MCIHVTCASLPAQVKTCSVLVVGALLYDRQRNAQGMLGATLALAAITAYSLLRLPRAGGSVAGGAGGLAVVPGAILHCCALQVLGTLPGPLVHRLAPQTW